MKKDLRSMPLSELMTDIDLIKKDGARIADSKAFIQSATIYTDAGHLHIEQCQTR